MQQIPELLFLALDHYRYPSAYDEQRSSAPLPPGVTQLLASPEKSLSDDNISETAVALAVTEDDCRAAVLRYIQLLMFDAPRDHYRVLGLPRNASAEQIAQHYQYLSRLLQSGWDVGEGDWGQRHAPRVEEAYAVLGDEGDRAIYDAKLAGGGIIIEWGKRKKKKHTSTAGSPATDTAATATAITSKASTQSAGHSASHSTGHSTSKSPAGATPPGGAASAASVSKYAPPPQQEDQPLPVFDTGPAAGTPAASADSATTPPGKSEPPSLLLSPWLYMAVALVGVMVFGLYTFNQASKQAAPSAQVSPASLPATPEAVAAGNQGDAAALAVAEVTPGEDSQGAQTSAELPLNAATPAASSPGEPGVADSNLAESKPAESEPAESELAGQTPPEQQPAEQLAVAPMPVAQAPVQPAPTAQATVAETQEKPIQAAQAPAGEALASPAADATAISDAELATLLQDFGEHYRAENAAAFAALFAADAYTPRAQGRADIAAYFEGIFNNIRVLELQFSEVAWASAGTEARQGSARVSITALPARRGIGASLATDVGFEVQRSAAGAVEITRLTF